MTKKHMLNYLHAKARELRLGVVRMLGHAGAGHYGGSLSAVEVVTALYFHVMKHDPTRPDWFDRDRFVLSKGHSCPILYVALAEAGYFHKNILKGHRKLGSILDGHPDMKIVPGVEMSSGSLGQGLSACIGMAIAGKMDNRTSRFYVMIGDGESQEGQIWEAAMFAAQFKLDNIVSILDYNKLQAQASIKDTVSLDPITNKWNSFGWHVIEIDGHNMAEILTAFEEAKQIKGKPTIIVSHTIKSKGVSFMEGKIEWHHFSASTEENEMAVKELTTPTYGIET